MSESFSNCSTTRGGKFVCKCETWETCAQRSDAGVKGCKAEKPYMYFKVRECDQSKYFISSDVILKMTFSRHIWDKAFKSGLSKFCGRQPLKNLLSPLLNTLSHFPLLKPFFRLGKK